MTRKQAARISNSNSRPFVEITVVTTWDGYRRAVAIPLNEHLRMAHTREKSTSYAAANPLGAVYGRGGHDCVEDDIELISRLKAIVTNLGYRVWENE